jgi:phosphoribosylanthranilate isomerase
MRVKICGITSAADAVAAEQAGADAIGLIFAGGSRRQVKLAQARQVRDAVGPLLHCVGVFRNAPLQQVLDVAAELQLQLVQLHGNEDADYVARVARVLPVIKAVPFSAQLGRQELQAWPASALLLDAVTPGGGIPFDWNQATALAGLPRLILAGGLQPANVAEAISVLRPWAVDTASGVESAPGVKDHGLIRSFVREARRAGAANRAEEA